MIEVSNDAYHADTTRISKSGLDLINKSPAHYWEKYLNPNRAPEEKEKHLLTGTQVHHAILEPHIFERRYHCLDDADVILQIGGKAPRNTNKYRDWLAEQMALNANKTLLQKDDYEMCLRMRDAVHSHPAAVLLLTQGIAEQTILFDEPQTGAKCKIRPDWMSGTGFLTDIKTTEDASPHGFGRSAYNYRYHVQGGFYVDGWAYGTGEVPEGFAFIAVEKEPPYNVAVYYMTEDAFSLGRSSYLRNLETYMKCLQNNKWPGYSNLMEPLSIPAYALK